MDEVPELSGPTLRVRALMNAARELTARMSRELGMNATDMVALDLLDVHGPMGAAELARRLGIRSASATVLVDRLEAAGHVERIRHHTDRRRVIVAARPSAREASLAVWLPAILAIDQVGRSLSEDEQRVVSTFLDRITAAITGPVAVQTDRG
ncbi:MarR family winged helix-turn-helix transcriptional regulator [Pseudonocardia charpentierae]|uniref:MarR family transcriptional regulator n=1 Tax=Pseudonocardia charpentierae TaxID=3075545 RepID=A0ABU2N536_9PSEU|nr:MarR family transcriptional regulator [Pseudonocardia sp. DSM 45834]MDT0349041.1 MarR family transcriptional regulator [Pseudonocardia sp. DSM 45834]